MKEYKFEALIKRQKDIDAAFIEIPFNVEKEFGKKRIKVKVYFDGYRGTLVKMGYPCYILGLNKSIRKAINK